MAYSAALLGWGSEVLGFDSPRSADHSWGPRLQIFWLPTAVLTPVRSPPCSPGSFRRPSAATPPSSPTARTLTAPPGHWVQVTRLRSWLEGQLAFDPAQPVGLLDWLATPTQRLAEVTAGAVFHDGLGELTQARARLAWFPDDVWLYVLACQWQRIAQEEAFPGRCSEAGDALGSAIVTARLARDLMRLCLLMARGRPDLAGSAWNARRSLRSRCQYPLGGGTASCLTYPCVRRP